MMTAIGLAELAILTLLALFGWMGTQFPFLRPVIVLGAAILLFMGMLRSSQLSVEKEDAAPTLHITNPTP